MKQPFRGSQRTAAGAAIQQPAKAAAATAATIQMLASAAIQMVEKNYSRKMHDVVPPNTYHTHAQNSVAAQIRAIT
jgi:hypothetical protein